MNEKFMQFGIWEVQLSIDEQMVPYFGRHSCKMFMRGKPIRFGYKLWCLCSSAGYLYNCIPYAGSADKYNKQLGLGADVVLRLLDNVEYPSRHMLYFDNFFTSYYLMCLLSEKQLCATGTVRANRIGGAQLKSGRQLEKGNHDFQFDTHNKILVCRWQDNSEVTIATNFDQILPMVPVKRWKKQKISNEGEIVEPGRYINYSQPQLIKNYNKGMGGMDLHDNAAQNYYIAIRSKKWYWPLWISVLNSAIVNAWKLDCFLRRYFKKNILPQKEFRVEIAYSLIMTAEENDSEDTEENVESHGDDSTGSSKDPHPKNLPRIRGQHLITKIENNKKWRCKLCHKPSSYLCKRCNVALHTHCFESYHIKQQKK